MSAETTSSRQLSDFLRIADLDRKKVPWKRFHEINFVNIDYKPFDASAWPPMDSGLLGPVRISIRKP